MPPANQNAWVRLGQSLTSRRVQISPRYANRRTFAAERGVNWRTIHDVELAKRDNFKPETIGTFETAYMLVPGSIGRALKGAELEPLPVAPEAPAVPAAEATIDADTEAVLGMLVDFIERPVPYNAELARLARTILARTVNGQPAADRVEMLRFALEKMLSSGVTEERRNGTTS